MSKFWKFLDEHAEDIISATLMSVATIAIVVQVIMRYLFKSSLSWSEELARYVFVWMTFITGWMLLGKVIRSGQISPAMSIPMYFIYLAPCIGYILSSIRCVQTIVLRVQNYKKGVEMND